MGKQGPCGHCGTQSTPLWRNGPPEKPVLCNACGSRYRTRGSLENYAPKHAQPQQIVKKARTSSKIVSKKGNQRTKGENSFSNYACYSTVSEDSMCSKSSSSNDSEISSSQSWYNNVEEEDGDDIQGETQAGSFWKRCMIPSRKRSFMAQRCLTPIQRLQRDLFSILKYEEDHNSMILSETAEDLLIYNANNLQISHNEIGLGSTLLEPVESSTLDETNSSLVGIRPSLSNVKVYGFNEFQHRSSPMDEFKKPEAAAADSTMSVQVKKEELSPTISD